MAVIWWVIGLGSFSNYVTIGIVLAIVGLVFGFAVAIHYRFIPVGDLKKAGYALERN